MDDEPTTQELRIEQAQRAREETERAREAPTEAGEHAAKRRADKAAYLRDKLVEQQAADETAS